MGAVLAALQPAELVGALLTHRCRAWVSAYQAGLGDVLAGLGGWLFGGPWLVVGAVAAGVVIWRSGGRC